MYTTDMQLLRCKIVAAGLLVVINSSKEDDEQYNLK